jgi:glycosyltransferase involved in cell wall biosynthesis
MKITIGIPTFNRLDILKIMAKSLYESNPPDYCNIRIYDDCSTQYDNRQLKYLFPTAVSISRNDKNMKADRNMYLMYKDFLNSNDDYFFNADSDIIFHKNWLEKSLLMILKTNGVLSIFNANSHESSVLVDNELCIKDSIGAAGTLFTRKRLEDLMAEFPDIEYVRGFDWQWSQYFTDNGVPMFCSNNSLVQHIGYEGQNSCYFFDFGKNFEVGSIHEGQIINDIFETFIDGCRIKRLQEEHERTKAYDALANDFFYHIKRCVIIIIKHLLPRKLIKKIKEAVTKPDI